jgi:hypothetical protein
MSRSNPGDTKADDRVVTILRELMKSVSELQLCESAK